MKMTRRAFVKANAAASAAAVAGITLPASAANLIASSDQTKITWDKAPCRFVVQAVLFLLVLKTAKSLLLRVTQKHQ